MNAPEDLDGWLRFGRAQTEAVTPYLDAPSNLRNVLSAVLEIEAKLAPNSTVQAALHRVLGALDDLRARLDVRSFVSSVENEKEAVLRAFDRLELMLQTWPQLEAEEAPKRGREAPKQP